MGFVQFAWHLLGFVLPALGMALLMPWAGRWVMGVGAWPLRRRMATHALCNTLVLVLGLYGHGQDGKMSTYIAMVLVGATAEWLMHRGWARH